MFKIASYKCGPADLHPLYLRVPDCWHSYWGNIVAIGCIGHRDLTVGLRKRHVHGELDLLVVWREKVVASKDQ